MDLAPPGEQHDALTPPGGHGALDTTVLWQNNSLSHHNFCQGDGAFEDNSTTKQVQTKVP